MASSINQRNSNSNEKDMKKYRYDEIGTPKEDRAELSRRCYEALLKKFTVVPEEYVSRLESELDGLCQTGRCWAFLEYADRYSSTECVADELVTRENVGNLLILYLCGITKYDPVKEGLISEFAIGYCGDLVLPLDKDLVYADNEYEGLISSLYRRAGKTAEDISYGDINILKGILEFQKEELPEICADSGTNWDYTKEIIRTANPDLFDDFVKLLLIKPDDGIWNNNLVNLISEQKISSGELVTSKDDLYNYFRNEEIPHLNALRIVKRTGSGGKVTVGSTLLEYSTLLGRDICPQWMQNYLIRINHLRVKSHAIENARKLWKLGYFKTYYPDVYSDVLRTNIGLSDD